MPGAMVSDELAAHLALVDDPCGYGRDVAGFATLGHMLKTPGYKDEASIPKLTTATVPVTLAAVRLGHALACT